VNPSTTLVILSVESSGSTYKIAGNATRARDRANRARCNRVSIVGKVFMLAASLIVSTSKTIVSTNANHIHSTLSRSPHSLYQNHTVLRFGRNQQNQVQRISVAVFTITVLKKASDIVALHQLHTFGVYFTNLSMVVPQSCWQMLD
jgi:hypothetical protein